MIKAQPVEIDREALATADDGLYVVLGENVTLPRWYDPMTDRWAEQIECHTMARVREPRPMDVHIGGINNYQRRADGKVVIEAWVASEKGMRDAQIQWGEIYG